MGQKIVIFAFNGDPTCFVHVLLNVLDLNQKGYQAVLVIEGAATKLIPDLTFRVSPLSRLYREVKDKGLISAVCRACSKANGVLGAVERENLPIGDDMSGHPSMSKYTLEGFTVITF
jgi:hypothetical protein